MGGLGSILCALKRPDLYKVFTSFAPICAPSKGCWGP